MKKQMTSFVGQYKAYVSLKKCYGNLGSAFLLFFIAITGVQYIGTPQFLLPLDFLALVLIYLSWKG